MTRTRIALTVTTLGLAGLLGLTGCGASGAGPSAAPAAVAVDVAGEAYALTSVGFETGLEGEPDPGASTGPKERKHGLRKQLRKNTLHGETTVRAKDGVRTIVVQRGTVTAVDARTVSVKSADGFTQTWTFGEKLKVVQNRKAAELSALKNGVEIGVAGAREGDKAMARLVAIR
ncbi:hypothetical protein AB0M36_03055 [Actinoplanes sp. NPDC051346]|uniref:hypothetical protein n=1 Tax=Actinoplanes sp. NPDC051346 TaxID=3155048 RepID=UPI0034227A94